MKMNYFLFNNRFAIHNKCYCKHNMTMFYIQKLGYTSAIIMVYMITVS